MIDSTKTGGTTASEAMATLRDAVQQAGVEAALRAAPLAEAECARE
ncbi:hypothetical protein ACWFR5_05285 [Streptomyces sp. NPDC055092]